MPLRRVILTTDAGDLDCYAPELVDYLLDIAAEERVLSQLLNTPDAKKLTPLHWATVYDKPGSSQSPYRLCSPAASFVSVSLSLALSHSH